MYRYLSLLLLLLSGCTSLKDFQAMDANSRAEFVCNREDAVAALSRQLSRYQDKITDIEQSLDTGYRVHRACRTVTVDVPSRVNCKTVESNGTKETTCTEIRTPMTKEVCSEIPVSIDADLEKENLQRYQDQLEKAKIEKNTAYYSCYTKIKPMSAEEAFGYYDNQ